MATKNNRSGSRKKTHKYIFISLYILGFAGAGIIGLFGNSFFAYEIFNSLWADILYLLFVSILYIAAFAEEVYRSRKPSDIVMNFFIFIVSLTFLLLSLFLGNVFIVCMTVYSAMILGFICLRYVLDTLKQTEREIDTKQLICAGSLLLFSLMSIIKVEFVNDLFVAWSLIPAAVISCTILLIAYLLMRKNWEIFFPTKTKCILFSILGVICIFFLSFMYSFTAVGTVNCAFDGEPTPTEYTVLEKHVLAGAKQVTEFEVKIAIDGEEKWINVPVSDYHNISEGDTVIVDYFNGALGFPYWKYAGNKSN